MKDHEEEEKKKKSKRKVKNRMTTFKPVEQNRANSR